MSLSRIIEFCSAVLVAFLILSVISFLSMRPILTQARIETKAEWDGFTRVVKQRNDLLPGLLEGLKGFEAGHSRLAERLMGARSVALRAVDPDRIVAAVDDMDRTIEQIKKIVQADPRLARYPPFEQPWKPVLALSRRISAARSDYNKSVQLYNRLLTPFPQNMLTALFGFVPLKEYPAPFVVDETSS
jgi:LemA protein